MIETGTHSCFVSAMRVAVLVEVRCMKNPSTSSKKKPSFFTLA